MSTALTPALRDQHEQAEARIEKNIATCRASWREIGTDLGGIRESRSYTITHATFEDYCQERWGFSRVYAHHLISSTDAVRELPTEMLTVVNAERVARAVAKVEPSVRVEVVEKALAHAKSEGRDKITARDVERMVEEPKSRSATTLKPSNALQYARMATSQLEKIDRTDTQFQEALAIVQAWIDSAQPKPASFMGGDYSGGARLSVKLDYDGPKLLSVEPDTGTASTASIRFTSYASLERFLASISSKAQWKRLTTSVRDHINGQRGAAS